MGTLAVTISLSVSVHAPSVVERPMSAPSSRKLGRRSIGVFLVIVLSSSRSSGGASVNDEAEIALVGADRLNRSGEAVNPVDAGEQDRLGVGCRRKSVIGTGQLLLRDCANNIRRHQDHQFGLVV